MEINGLKVFGPALIALSVAGGIMLACGGGGDDEYTSLTDQPAVEETVEVQEEQAQKQEQPNEGQSDPGSSSEIDPSYTPPETGDEDQPAAAPDETPSQPSQPAPPQPPASQPEPVPPAEEDSPVPPVEEPAAVNEAPLILAVLPADGATGVFPDASIVMTFSEPMDTDSVEAAFSLSTGACGDFDWSADATVVAFHACADWDYGTEVEVELAASAADTAGLGLVEGFESEFTVLRQTTVKLLSTGSLDGHVVAPGVFMLGDKAASDGLFLTAGTWSRVFLSFDLSDLPENLVEIKAAEISVKQTSHEADAYSNATGALVIESATYGTLDAGDWSLSPNISCAFCLIPVLSSDPADGWKKADVLGYVQGDWENREAREFSSQFRLRFAKDCADGMCANISAEFRSGNGAGVARPYLSITYTHP